ncbi:putative uncharacterized protein [Tetragenococcus halophilus subsp. halophilus]|uniref:Uncharacterized protein n=3 Tax=Tetragenococcus halophilus TaxID=51669 RepID=A0A2H6CBB7_TETHA|nr:recombinase [Tetragenococcus halophilus]RQD33428.1 recombinase [Tetragenococcus halophilus subsp. halophilus DSM 20339]BAK95234.1 hypothetical protein TEH_19070 [Tetragenococcus halophilus NBRC 12172]GBD59300.1 putative uncharacterized protein [Tetragenococcus halophilus subsp. halophilus]GBD64384.1 putative uncharacterized protein [Tetragenococcus halophilus subsp. flandriensis]
MEEEANVEEIKKQNKQLLDEFEQELIDKKLSAKTIYKHVNNIDFYINTFLLYDEFVEAKKGTLFIGEFLGYWFIKKAMWSSVKQINENATSLKKFYTFLYKRGDIRKETLDSLKERIKLEKPQWHVEMRRYDFPFI